MIDFINESGTNFVRFFRLQMDVNGGNTDKKWQKEIHVHEHITGAPWQPVVRSENKYD